MIKLINLFLVISFFDTLYASNKKPFTNQLKGDVDNCRFEAGRSVIGYQEALNCYNSFKFNETIRQQTIDTLSKTIPFYAFLDISKQSSEPKISLQVDLEKELKIISNKIYKTELQFQTDLTELFRSLNDGHTVYHSNCFSTFSFHQPFPLATIKDDIIGQKFFILNKFSVRRDFFKVWQKEGIDIFKYAGSEVLLINGVPTSSYLIHYANTKIGKSKDINSRMNWALTRIVQNNGTWELNDGKFQSPDFIPSQPSITYTLKLKDNQIKNVTVPYLVYNPNNFKNKLEFYQSKCAYIPPKPKFQSKSEAVLLSTVAPNKLGSKVKTKANQDPWNILSSSLTKGKDVSTWLLPNQTGVMTITSFMPNSNYTFINEANAGFKALLENNVTNLILDLSNNEGGIVCLGYYVLNYLFPNSERNHFDGDIRISKLLMMMFERDRREGGSFNPSNWINSKDVSFNNSLELMGSNQYKRGESFSRYTKLSRPKCDSNPLSSKVNIHNTTSLHTKPLFGEGKLIVLTNSICISTCSILVNGLQEFYKVPTYALGGVFGSEATPSQTSGGPVYNLNNLLNDIQELGLQSHPDSPNHFPINAQFSFALGEAYSTQRFESELKGSQNAAISGPRPLDFTWNSATYHKQYPNLATFMSPYQQWLQIANDFF